MSQTIKIVRGTTKTFDITLKDANGNPYVLQSGEKLIFGVKGNPNSSSYDIKKIMTSSDYSSGKYHFTINPADTASLACAFYRYDLGLQNGNNYFNVIEISTFELVQNITVKEA